MKKEEKDQLINILTEQLKNSNNFYLADISDLNAKDTFALRRLCFKRNITLTVVKNSLLKKAMERSDKDLGELITVLHGNTSIMFAEGANVPAKLIREFRKTSQRPLLKGAYVEESIYLGDNQLETLENIKSKNELIGDIVALLMSPARNVISGLQSGGQKLSGIVKTLSERGE